MNKPSRCAPGFAPCQDPDIFVNQGSHEPDFSEAVYMQMNTAETLSLKKIAESEKGLYSIRHEDYPQASVTLVERDDIPKRLETLTEKNLDGKQYTLESVEITGPFRHLNLGNPRTGGKN